MLYIFGNGGFAREVQAFLQPGTHSLFVVDDEFYEEGSHDTIKYSDFVSTYSWYARSPFTPLGINIVTVAVGDPNLRQRLAEKVKSCIVQNIQLQGSKQIFSPSAGTGNIFCPGSIITVNVSMGDFNHFNLNSTVGHDCVLGDFNTISPGVNISGNCKIGNKVYLGTNCALREGVSICDDVVVGMGSVVLKDIIEPGTYAGVPCKKIK